MKANMKKILVLATLLMLVSLVFANTSKAATTELKNNLSVSSVSGEAGKEVKVNITATADLSVEDGGLLLKYDAKKLQYKSSASATVNGLMTMVNNRDDGFIVAMAATGEDAATISKGTVIATVTFKILEGTTGTVNLTLVDEQEDAQPTLATGKVTVKVPSTGTTPSEGTTQTPSTDKTPSEGTTQTPSTDKTPSEGTTQTPSTDKTPSEGTTQTPSTDKTPSEGTTQTPSTDKTPTTNSGSTSNNNSTSTTKKPTTTTTTNKKDNTPKTGVSDLLVLAIVMIVVASIGITFVVKHN